MAQGTKTDNACPDVKLALRRYMLDRYHVGEPIRVLDCCQGSGVLWGTLQQEYDLAGYWGVDVKHKPGRLKLDSSRILARPGWRENVIDIDTYGSPWKHWTNLIKTIDHPTTVFLTIGQVNIGTDLNILRVLGLHKLRTRPPKRRYASWPIWP